MKKKILVKGPVLTQSGYGEQSRFALRALRSKEDLFDIYIQPIRWGNTGWIWTDSEFRQWMDERIIRTQILAQQGTLQVDMTLQVTIPDEFEKMSNYDIGYTAGIETTHAAPKWLQKGNEIDKILVVSNHSKDSYVGTKATAVNNQTGEEILYTLTTPVEVVHEITPRAEPVPIPEFAPNTKFNFLLMSQWSPRKNIENSIKWWVEEFHDQNVGLVVKTNMSKNSLVDYNLTNGILKKLLSEYQDRKCKIYLLHGDLSEGQMTWLYQHEKIKAMINISHGEGFGLPLFEAAREALPIVSVGWSGQVDFLRHNNKDYFESVKYELKNVQKEAVWPGIIEAEAKWAFADSGSYKMCLRKVHKKWKQAKKRSIELQSLVNEKFNEEKLFQGFCDAVYKPDPELLEWQQNLDEMETL